MNAILAIFSIGLSFLLFVVFYVRQGFLSVPGRRDECHRFGKSTPSSGQAKAESASPNWREIDSRATYAPQLYRSPWFMTA
ncbi:MAG: hypothetical protein KJ964_02315 [Verrucomicrobia bacterium]|nr:hypothetical protein [Verrucomicrobiota bacterium]MBU1735916.1 hypothetical protein [Verrucomicrobiota bacterium]MBU1857152.1 hypothetical protein [Verrucomicrobiota bacterium]